MSDLNLKACELYVAANARIDGLISSAEYQKVANAYLELFGEAIEPRLTETSDETT